MSSFYQVEEIFDDLKKGRINDFDAESELRRINSSSCMRSSISKIVRDVEYGFRDSYDASRDFKQAERSCEYKRREHEEESEREDRERWGY